jgi:hypothetical protein
MERGEEMFDLRTVDGVRLNPLCEEESDNDFPNGIAFITNLPPKPLG